MGSIINYLEQYCDELTPREFYRLIFPPGSLEPRGVQDNDAHLYNAIAMSIGTHSDGSDKIRTTIITDELDQIDEIVAGDDFTIISPITYAGRRRKSENARYLYAIAVDLDGLRLDPAPSGEPISLVDLWHQVDIGFLPAPTALVASGSGLHLYYIFERPIACFKDSVKELEKLKKALTWKLWTQGLSDLHNSVQYESLFQGFRVPGTVTKYGTRARAFLFERGEKVSVEYLNGFVSAEDKANLDRISTYKPTTTLEQAKKLWPEWYSRRVIEKQPKGRWYIKRDLYNWWLRQLRGGKAKVGGRYWAVHALAVYARKCDVPRDELERDALSLVDDFDALTIDEKNHFTRDDVLHALEAYNDEMHTYPRKVIEDRTMIRIDPSVRRNGRSMAEHLRRARLLEELDHPNGSWRKYSGRKSKADVVAAWRRDNPKGRKIECIKATGLSKSTVYKHWES